MSRSMSILVFLVSLAGILAHKTSIQPSLSRNTCSTIRLKSAVSLFETLPKTIPSLIKTQSLASKGQDVCRGRNFWFLQELTIGWSRGLGDHRSIRRLTLIHAHISDPTNETFSNSQASNISFTSPDCS